MYFFNLYLPKQIDRGLESKSFSYLILYFWTILGFLGWQIGFFFFNVIGYLLGVLGENIFIREKNSTLNFAATSVVVGLLKRNDISFYLIILKYIDGWHVYIFAWIEKIERKAQVCGLNLEFQCT
jgi:hypothetical protein